MCSLENGSTFVMWANIKLRTWRTSTMLQQISLKITEQPKEKNLGCSRISITRCTQQVVETDILLKSHNDIICNLRKRHCTVAESLDVENGFISLFFSNRRFCIQFHNNFSDLDDVRYGFPQGLILAPHLYSIFMYDCCVMTTLSLVLSWRLCNDGVSMHMMSHRVKRYFCALIM